MKSHTHPIRLFGALLLTALAATGCTGGVQRVDGAAVPHGAAAASSPTPAPASPSPSIPTSPSASPSKSVTPRVSRTTTAPVRLGPDGYGALKLGMTRAEAQATGLITGYRVVDVGTTECGEATLENAGGKLYFSLDQGLISINAANGMRTAEGIRVGSTLKAVTAAYPDFEIVYGTDAANDSLSVNLPGVARYHLDTRDGEVVHLSLALDNIFTSGGCLD